MLRYRIVLLTLMICSVSISYSQAYMHEAYEDAVESGSDGASSVISMLIFFSAISVAYKIHNHYKENKKKNEEIKHKTERATEVATTIIQMHPDISKYQTKVSWQKGFANATYDLSQNSVKPLVGKTVDDLVQEYRNLCEKGHMIQAESIMEKTGYYQKLEFNQKQEKTEQKRKHKTHLDNRACNQS